MVTMNGRLEIHSRTSPAGIVSSDARPSSVRTRSHVGSIVRATRRYGDTMLPSWSGGGSTTTVAGFASAATGRASTGGAGFESAGRSAGVAGAAAGDGTDAAGGGGAAAEGTSG